MGGKGLRSGLRGTGAAWARSGRDGGRGKREEGGVVADMTGGIIPARRAAKQCQTWICHTFERMLGYNAQHGK